MAKRPRPSRPRTRTRGTGTSTARTSSTGYSAPIFASGVDDAVPGEVIVQLEEGAAGMMTASVARGPSRGRRMGLAASFGVDELDQAIRRLKPTAITQLHPPAPVVSAAMDLAVPMASTFRVSYEADIHPVEAAKQLGQTAGVAFAEANRYRETYAVPNDPSFAAQWGLTKINAPAAWDRTTGSANVVVAVIDTGVDLDHPELAPLIVAGTDMVDLGPNPTPPAGFRFEGDFQGRDNNPQDEVGHGTHVAGTIACLSNNGVGVAGVTWSCRIMPVRVLARIVNLTNANDVRGTGSAADIAAGIRWAVDNGARVLNMSLGGGTDTQVERDAVAYAVAHGAVVVAAMGNGGLGAGNSFPAAYPDVVAVGAIDQSDHRASFSQVGPHIDIAGPGVGVLSTVWDNGYTTMSGTSMATPHVAGVAALVLSCNGNLTGAQVADILRQTARPLRDNAADPVPNNNYGFGCVDAQAAVNRACPRRSTPILTCPQQSTIIRCATNTVACRPSLVVACPSTVTICPSVTVICTRPSNPVITCPQPSIVIRCPSGPVCSPQGPIENPGPLGGAAEQQEVDEWGLAAGDYTDPYAMHYHHHDCSCGKQK